MIKNFDKNAQDILDRLTKELEDDTPRKDAQKRRKDGEVNLHDGHRERLRERFAENLDFNGFSEHEVLELMLFYALPRVDTNELSHTLVNTFGGLFGVLNAPLTELSAVSGLGRKSALFIKLIMRMCVEYNISLQHGINVNNYEKLCSYVRYQFSYEKEECAKLFCVDKGGDLSVPFEIGRGLAHKTHIDLRKTMLVITNTGVQSIVVAHNHISGLPEPSKEDIVITRRLRQMIEPIGVTLLDHLVVTDSGIVSMRERGMMDI